MYDRRGKNLFKTLILLYGQVTSICKSIFGNIVVGYQKRNPLQTFSGGCHFKRFEEIVSGEVTF